jgi:hypothetical protein
MLRGLAQSFGFRYGDKSGILDKEHKGQGGEG